MWGDFDTMHAYGATLPALEVTLSNGMVVSFEKGETIGAMTVVSDPTGQYQPGHVFRPGDTMYAVYLLAAMDAVRRDRSAAQVRTSSDGRVQPPKIVPPTKVGPKKFIETLDQVHPYLKHALIVVAVGGGIYGGYYLYRRFRKV